jgi:sterol desaturase/sphingolipid hydroxylase (fatty acid hydroxylase superfamily)
LQILEQVGHILLNHGKTLIIYAAVLILLEKFFIAQRTQESWRSDSKLDLMYSFLLPIIVSPIYGMMILGLSGFFWGVDGGAVKVNMNMEENALHGKSTISSQGNIDYIPDANFVGEDYFTIRNNDGRYFTNSLIQVSVSSSASSKEPTRAVNFSVEKKYRSGGSAAEGVGFFLKLRNFINSQNLIVQVLIALFILDFFGYLRHRLMHSKYLWPFHSIHHSSRQIDWLSTERNHPINFLIIVTLNLVAMIAVFDFLYVATISVLIRRGYGFFVHSNIRVSYGPLDYVFVSPLFHRWHHTDAKEGEGKNFAIIFSFVDVLFGSYRLPKGKEDSRSFGIFQEEIPNELWAQFIYPFKKLFQMKSNEL